MPTKTTNVSEQSAAEELLRRRRARRSFLDFVTYTKSDYIVNWHHRKTAEAISKWVSGNILNLIVCEPPRHGKSEQSARRLPPYIFGQHPDARVIFAAYADPLARSMSRAVQRIIQSDTYKNLFPGTLLGSHKDARKKFTIRTASEFEIVDQGGYYKAVGIGGGITGHGGTHLILDDPIKDYEEAHSSLIRDSVWNWFTSTFLTRREPGAGVLITTTRWHEDDPVGRLLDREPGNWHLVWFPAMTDADHEPSEADPRKPNKALWPDRYNEEYFRQTRVQVGPYVWNSVFQNRPASPEGTIFKRHYWRRYGDLPDDIEFYFQSWDTAFKEKETSDYSVGGTFAISPSGIFLIDVVRGRLSFPNLKLRARRFFAKHPYSKVVLIEDRASGQSIIQEFLMSTRLPVMPIPSDTSKLSRAHAVSGLCEAGRVFLPTDVPWVETFINELANFPAGKHDDQVDMFTQGILYVRDREMAEIARLGETEVYDPLEHLEPIEDWEGVYATEGALGA